ncbi:hypothetical protein GCM10011371_29540 [Novosphingobium marinum]|uniref:FHA domain-containing protein n=1 Tax=Novosphingobium marinum TaxID=1514948 RepID=A0A7Z0BUZ8_9SPHN|nr:SpoIIE family protein phosphatase [Novosphingobium marinum]NYH96784.1 hypothetical protein [Novosphingobium marinum]GGC40257.1 hypothetical protein GCM10011371_29540 [Novosphingobium marinum]
MADSDQTQIILGSNVSDLIGQDRIHCLEMTTGLDVEERYAISAVGLEIGRVPPADIVISDVQVSRSHCRVQMKDGAVVVTDLGSTNGTFIDGKRVEGSVMLPVGSMLAIGSHKLKHAWRTPAEIEKNDDFSRELQRATAYVRSLLPPPSREAPIRADWVYEPSAKLGGDAFGYGQLSDTTYVGYLIDVAGHGASAAMHAVSIMNNLRQKALPGADMRRPGEVLAALNNMYQMDEHAGLYFTAWYGVYDTEARRLDYASGGHHPTYLVPPSRSAAIPMRTRNVIIGAMPEMTFREASMHVPEGASIYMFSDGVYEIVDTDDHQWNLKDFVKLMLEPPIDGVNEAVRIYDAVRHRARPETLDDDFSLVVLTFD